jgi:hypothetical protein
MILNVALRSEKLKTGYLINVFLRPIYFINETLPWIDVFRSNFVFLPQGLGEQHADKKIRLEGR